MMLGMPWRGPVRLGLAVLLLLALAVPFPQAAAEEGAQAPAEMVYDFSWDQPGQPPQGFSLLAGRWQVREESENKVLVVDGRQGNPELPREQLAALAAALFGGEYPVFVDNLRASRDYPLAVPQGLKDFRQGVLSVRFFAQGGREDQAAGIAFGLGPVGNYLVVRANALENNLGLFQFRGGKRQALQWVQDVLTPAQQWHELRLVISGNKLEAYLDYQLKLTHTLPGPVSGRVGLWSKSDSHVWFDDFRILPEGK